MECFVEYRGKIYANMNWQHRKSGSQVMERHLLNRKQLDIYCRMKAKGETDYKIFRTLFPPENKPPLRFPKRSTRKNDIYVSKLKKPELVKLLKKEFKRNLTSLQRMKKADLRDMYYILQRLKEN